MTQHEVNLGFFPHFPFSFFSPVDTVSNTVMFCQKLLFSEAGISLDSAKKASSPRTHYRVLFVTRGKKKHLLALLNSWLEVVFY